MQVHMKNKYKVKATMQSNLSEKNSYFLTVTKKKRNTNIISCVLKINGKHSQNEIFYFTPSGENCKIS